MDIVARLFSFKRQAPLKHGAGRQKSPDNVVSVKKQIKSKAAAPKSEISTKVSLVELPAQPVSRSKSLDESSGPSVARWQEKQERPPPYKGPSASHKDHTVKDQSRLAPLDHIGLPRTPRLTTAALERSKHSLVHGVEIEQRARIHAATAVEAFSDFKKPLDLDKEHPAFRKAVYLTDHNMIPSDNPTTGQPTSPTKKTNCHGSPRSPKPSSQKRCHSSHRSIRGQITDTEQDQPLGKRQDKVMARKQDKVLARKQDNSPSRQRVTTKRSLPASLKQRKETLDSELPELPPRTPKSSSTDSTSSLTPTSSIAGSLDTPCTSIVSDTETVFEADEPSRDIDITRIDIVTTLLHGEFFNLNWRDFNWAISAHVRQCARQYASLPRDDRESDRVYAQNILHAFTSFNHVSPASAEAAWSKLHPESNSIRQRDVTAGFCQYLLHLIDVHHHGHVLPRFVPVEIRARTDLRYIEARRQIKGTQEDPPLAKWIDSLDGEKQGISLIALMELSIVKKGELGSANLLHAILEVTSKVETLRHVSDLQISNFFATYIRAFTASARDGHTTEEDLSKSSGFFYTFWSLCTAQYSMHESSNRLILFRMTIGKLENSEIPMCVWIFLAGQGIEDHAVEDIYLAFQSELEARSPGNDAKLLAFVSIILFLRSVSHQGFTEILYRFICAKPADKELWEATWRVLGRSEGFGELHQRIDHNFGSIRVFLEEVSET